MTTFDLNAEQDARAKAFLDYHHEVVHKGGRTLDVSGFCCWFMFGPTGMGTNVKVVCAYCPQNSKGSECDLSIEEEVVDGTFIYQYDENWNRTKAFWEKPWHHTNMIDELRGETSPDTEKTGGANEVAE